MNWVLNLRSAGGEATLTRGRRTEKITATELSPEQAAPIFRWALQTGAPRIPSPIMKLYRRFFALPYLDVDVDSSLEAFERQAATHPIFVVRTAP